LELLRSYEWPGNVRQLKNEIDRVVALTNSDWVTPEEFSADIRETSNAPSPTEGTLKEREKQIILERLHEKKWNIFHTAKSLGLTRNGLYGKMRNYTGFRENLYNSRALLKRTFVTGNRF
jgi:two-component system response regulator HupR/HoxA